MEENQIEGQPEATTQETVQVAPKFKSVEEQAKAYLELEAKATQQAQELAEMKRKLDDFQSTVPQQEQRQEPAFTDVYKSQEELKQFWARFAQKPQEVLQEFTQRAVEQAEQRVMVREMAKDAIAEFKAKNPDLAPYGEIVSIFVNRQPTNLSPSERLERAAPEARKMIAQIAQKQGSPAAQSIDAATYVEAPTSGSRPSAPAPKPETQEDSLAEYLKESALRQQKQQTPPRISK